MPGGILSISAQGDQDGTGIVWASHPISDNANQAVVDGMLRALDRPEQSYCRACFTGHYPVPIQLDADVDKLALER